MCLAYNNLLCMNNAYEKRYIMKKKIVLLIEDNPDHAALITDVLKDENGMTVVLIKDGQEAIDYFKESGPDSNGETPQIDVIISDLNLPKVNGMEILKFLKRGPKYSSIPVVICSTSNDKKVIREAQKNGADAYITKSTSYEQVIEDLKILNDCYSSTNTLVDDMPQTPKNTNNKTRFCFKRSKTA